MTQKKILIVDDEPINLSVLKEILKDDYRLIFARSGEEALVKVTKTNPDLILLDVNMLGMSGYEVCKKLKESPETEDIPVIFVTGLVDINNEYKGFEVGAVDYITKPVLAEIVKSRVRIHISLTRTKNLEITQLDALKMLATAGEYKDTDLGVHIWRMADYCHVLALELGWDYDRAELMRVTAPMHDLGKIGISDNILKKPGKLTEDEWSVMRTHSIIGHRILSMSKSDLFKMAANIALNHHERWDGTGYPNGLKGEEIPIEARIAAIADVFDALNMDRPYKARWSMDRIVNEISTNSGKHFDPALVDVFIRLVPKFEEVAKRWDNKGKD